MPTRRKFIFGVTPSPLQNKSCARIWGQPTLGENKARGYNAVDRSLENHTVFPATAVEVFIRLGLLPYYNMKYLCDYVQH